jgi:hypothetical protein
MLKKGRTMKYCLAYVIYCARSPGVVSKGTYINKALTFSSVTKSTYIAINGSDKIASTIHLVS